MTPAERFAARARALARSVLDRPPFRRPRSTQGFLGRILGDVGHAIVTSLRWIVQHLEHRVLGPAAGFAFHGPLGTAVTAVLVAGVAAVCLVAWRRSHRGDRTAPPHHPEAPARVRRRSPLLPLAEQALARGDLDDALRLRFQAGLEGLEARGLVHEREHLTTRRLSEALASPTFDELARDHAEVAYAGVAADRDAVERAFGSWPAVEREARVAVDA